MESCVFSPQLKKGSVELLILSILEDQAVHGYEIGKLIEVRSQGRLQFRVSTLYPVLCRMEDSGWIKGRWVEKQGQRRRRYYRLTAPGRTVLARERKTWEEFTIAMGLVLDSKRA
jgi:transcriptional regulator